MKHWQEDFISFKANNLDFQGFLPSERKEPHVPNRVLPWAAHVLPPTPTSSSQCLLLFSPE